MDDVIEEVNRALRARGWSARYASRQLGGSPEFIRNLRRGYFQSILKFRSLCELLDLEFYVGPRREMGAADERRIEEAIAATERMLSDAHLVLGSEDKAGVVAAVYGFIGEDRSPSTTARVNRLIVAMAGEHRRAKRRSGRRRAE